jgi:hypothetical protein
MNFEGISQCRKDRRPDAHIECHNGTPASSSGRRASTRGLGLSGGSPGLFRIVGLPADGRCLSLLVGRAF